MSFSSFFTGAREEVDLILDIGSGSVGAALVVYAPHKKPSIVYSVRKDLAFQKRLDPKRLPLLLTNTLASVLDAIMKDGVKHLRFTRLGTESIRDVHVVVASPWYVSHTKSISLKKEEPFEVTKSLLDGYILAEQQALMDSLPTHEELFEEGVRPIEHSVVRMLLNGYETPFPYGKHAKEITLSIYVSLMPEHIATLIDTAIRSFFHPKHIQFHSYGLATFTAMRTMYPDVSNFIFLDFGSEVSDIFLIKNGVLTDTLSVPCGKHTFVRAIAHALDVEESVALSSLRLAISDQSDPTLLARIADILGPTKEEWLVQLTMALDIIEKESTLPDRVYVTADPDILTLVLEYGKLMRTSLAGDQWHAEQVGIAPHNFGSFVHLSSGATSDVFLALEALYIEQLMGSKE